MKQLIQHLQNGKTTLEDIPAPALKAGHIVVRSTYSLVSTGTEKMIVEFSKASLLNKVRNNPERVEQVLNKISSDGLLPTLVAVFRKLEEPLPLGYSNVGIVTGVGEGVNTFRIGDRVISNGPHAEYVSIPQNLACKIPQNVSDEQASFTVVGAIALQSIRLANAHLGEKVCVIGLGLIGLLTCQLLKAAGCNVYACDIDENKLNLAKKLNINAFNSNITDVETIANGITGQLGFDTVIIAATAKNDSIVNTAAKATRKRGKIILIGVVDLHLDRSEFYKKEITFQVSCSYGPGRYDENYEELGIDYPEAFVKWTVKRNFEAVLNCLAEQQLITEPLISEIIDFNNADKAYADAATSGNLATLLKYNTEKSKISHEITFNNTGKSESKIKIGVIGAGNYSNATLIPSLKKTGAYIKYICGNDGLDAGLIAKKFDIPHAVTDLNTIINDKEINLVIIATRHDSHAQLSSLCLQANKNVFVEKPIAINLTSLEEIKQIRLQYPTLLFQTGFNRRFAPLSQKLRSLIPENSIININITVNAGALPTGHWLFDKNIGGGRIVGEACHFIDLMTYFTGSLIESVYATEAPITGHTENTIIHLRYKNGSHGTIHYLANGHKKFAKEKIEIFVNNKIYILDNFRKLHGYGTTITNPVFSSQDKGHVKQFENLLASFSNDSKQVIPFSEIYNTTKASLLVAESILTNMPQMLD